MSRIRPDSLSEREHVRVPRAAGERVIFFPEIEAFGGEERAVLALSRHLHERGIPHKIACYYLSVDLQSHAHWPLKIEELRPRRNGLSKAWALREYLKGAAGNGSGTALLVGIQAARHAGMFARKRGQGSYFLRISDTPSLLSTTANTAAGRPCLSEAVRDCATHFLTRRGFRKAQAAIATTKYLASEMKDLYGVEAEIVWIGGYEGGLVFKRRPVHPGGAVRLLSVGRLESSKRIDWILRSLARLKARGMSPGETGDLVLDVVGTGLEERALRELAQELDLGRRAVFHGFVSDGELESIYADAHIFVMPARQGFGVPALEALSRGIPVVLHRESGVSEVLEGTSWAEIVDGDVAGLTPGIESMIGRLRRGELGDCPLPPLPTEQSWAETVCRTGGWI